MNKKILVIVLALAVGIGVYTYWPLIAPYLPKESQPPIAVVTAAATTTTAPPPVAEATPEASMPTAEAAAPEPRFIDPFALRTALKSKYVPGPAAPAAPGPPGQEKPAVKPSQPKLEGIWVDSSMRVAFISGQALNTGGTIMGWKVTSISKDRVTLQKGRSVKILRMEGLVK